MAKWQHPEECVCGAKGDSIEEPLWCGECDECGGEMCCKCGTVEGDTDGNLYVCKTCDKAA